MCLHLCVYVLVRACVFKCLHVWLIHVCFKGGHSGVSAIFQSLGKTPGMTSLDGASSQGTSADSSLLNEKVRSWLPSSFWQILYIRKYWRSLNFAICARSGCNLTLAVAQQGQSIVSRSM